MAIRPTWQGHLRLSLVTCPVALYTAISPRGDVHFNMLHKSTHNRIRMVPTDPETGPVDRADIVKGYEVEKGRYVVVTQDEINSVKLESTRTIDIERFVAVDEIDRLYWNDPYYMAPDGKMAAEAFAVIREAMKRQGRIAIGRLVLHQRERMLALEPREDGMIAYSLRTKDEVRDAGQVFDPIPDAKADAKMVDIAEKIIDQLEGPFDPSEFTDRYETALKALIKAKEGGKGRTVSVEEPKDTDATDLMEQLRRSLGQSDGGSKRRSSSRTEHKPARRKPASSTRKRA
jgi:DNA end-binding protein Ku